MVDNLLRKGFNVRGVVRSSLKERADSMLRARPQYRKQLEFAFIEDLAIPGVFDESIKGIDAVIHTAGVSLMSENIASLNIPNKNRNLTSTSAGLRPPRRRPQAGCHALSQRHPLDPLRQRQQRHR